MAILAVFAGLVLLVKGGDWLLQAAVSLSLKLKIPKMVIGMTVVSFATSMPELIVSIQSALTGSENSPAAISPPLVYSAGILLMGVEVAGIDPLVTFFEKLLQIDFQSV